MITDQSTVNAKHVNFNSQQAGNRSNLKVFDQVVFSGGSLSLIQTLTQIFVTQYSSTSNMGVIRKKIEVMMIKMVLL